MELNKKSTTTTTNLLIDESSKDSGFSPSPQMFNDVSFEICHSSNTDSPFSQVFKIQDRIEKTISLKRNLNFNETLIKESLDKKHQIESNQNGRLIGDMTKDHILPTLSQSKHNDLASISSDTVIITNSCFLNLF
jgi:hypothetical protein